MEKPSRAAGAAGQARPIVIAIIVVLATAIVVLGYAFLTRDTGRTPVQPPEQVPEQPKKEQPKPPPVAPLPRTSTKGALIVPIPPVKPPDTPVPSAFKDAFFYDDFSGKELFAGGKWIATRDGDFKEAVADIVEGRLRFRVGTIGTRDDTVKHLGIRSAQAVVDLARPVEIGAEMDWNKQANGCYLQASLYICPTASDKTAANEKEWLRFEYVGVPPGKNARASLYRHRAGNLGELYTEGWPTKQKAGRPIGKQKVLIRLDQENAEVIENGSTWWGPAPHGLALDRAYLYAEVCSHSNYPPREIFFDNIVVRPARPGL
jgi:hypothetical protein